MAIGGMSVDTPATDGGTLLEVVWLLVEGFIVEVIEGGMVSTVEVDKSPMTAAIVEIGDVVVVVAVVVVVGSGDVGRVVVDVLDVEELNSS